jgi:hypothetical protein
MKLRFLRLFIKINMPTILFSQSSHKVTADAALFRCKKKCCLLQINQGRGVAPCRLFIDSVIGCNPILFPVICETNEGYA